MSDAKTSTAKNSNLLNKVMTASLQGWNKYLALLYAVQGIIVLVLSVDRSYPVVTSFLGLDSLQTQSQGRTVLTTGAQHLFDINLTYLVAAFLFVSAIAHGLLATKLRSTYDRDIKKGVNRARWVEYALSAGLMMVLIGLLVGVQDASTLLLLFGVTAVANLLGLVTEMYNQGARKVNCFSYIVGCITGVLPWIVAAIYLISGGIVGAAAPAFVYWIVGSLFLLFCSLAANMYLLYRKKGTWKDYTYGERVFMILSFVAKTALAWQVFAGTLHP
jgi:hypothetical protein